VVGEGPVVEIEITLALDQDGPGPDVEIVEGIDQTFAHGPLQLQKGGGRNRDPDFLKHIKEIYEHGWSY
jgi:hypothetical protein